MNAYCQYNAERAANKAPADVIEPDGLDISPAYVVIEHYIADAPQELIEFWRNHRK